MRIVFLFLTGLSVLAILTCKDDAVNQDAGREIARIFFTDASHDMNVEEVRGDSDNRITCKFVETLDAVQVVILGANNRRFQMEFDNVQDINELKILNGFAEYVDQNGALYETIGPALQEVEISWRPNFDICEFTWAAGQNPVQLSSNTAPPVFLDSLKIETLREDDL